MILDAIASVTGSLIGLGVVRAIMWIVRRPSPEPPEPTVTASALAMLKEIGKPPPQQQKRGWFKNRPGWLGPTPNEKLVSAVGMGYASTIKAATEHHWTPQEKIALARQAFAQEAITIDELERVIEDAIKDGA